MAKSELQTLQRQFLHYVLTGQHDEIIAQLDKRSNDNIVGQLTVYAEGYRLRFLDILSATFRLTKRLMSNERFNRLANDYIEGIRSNHFTVDTINDNFPQFLIDNGESLIAQVAYIEWCIDQTLIAPIGECLTLAQLQQQAASGLTDYQLSLQPSLMTLPFNSTAIQVWQAYWVDQPLPQLVQAEQQHWLLWLREIYPTVRPSTAIEKSMVELVFAGQTFGEICEALCEQLSEQEAANFAVGCLQQWLEEGLLVS